MTNDASWLRWHAFHTPKRGNAPEEYEDAYAGDPVRGRFAVADGASESSFVAEWARLLVEGFVNAEKSPWRELEWMGAQRQRWAADIDARPLPWYAEDKREQGAYATLLGIGFRRPTDAQPGVWRALAVGDSCLFRLRDGHLRQSFPLTHSSDFGNQPPLLGSRGRSADTPEKAVRRIGGKWRRGDRFLLMTDALAEWTLRRSQEDKHPTEEIAALLDGESPPDAFAAWVEERRG